uniref:Uncharacterized protein n=3 Tax=Meloidogyne TaxID=189290 RepID=A0A915NW09_9BILA
MFNSEIALLVTSQIIAQLPREPPELIEKEEDVEELNYLMGHIPPPPAPMPLLAFPTTSSTNSTRQVTFGCSLSQPTTPRNVQRMFGPFDDIQQQQQPPLQNLTFLHSPPNNRRNGSKTILFSSQLPQRNGYVVQSSDLTELYGNNLNGRTAASAR